MRVVTLGHQELLRLIVQLEDDISDLEPLHHFVDFQVQDFDQVRLGQGTEDDQIIQPVKELRTEGFPGLIHYLLAHPLVAALVADRRETEGRLFFDGVGADVGGHQNNRVPEIDHPADVVGQFALFQDLQQQVPNIRVSLFDLVEENHGIGLAADLLG